MKKLILAASLLFSFPALAQNYQATQGAGTTFGTKLVGGVNYPQFTMCDPTTPAQCATVDASGNVSFKTSNFAPNGNYTTLTSTAASSASTALPAGVTVAFQNTSNEDVSCVLSAGAATATTNKTIVHGGSTLYLTVGSNVNAACINQVGTSSNVISLAGGTGTGTSFGTIDTQGLAAIVQGPAATGTALSGNPVRVGMSDGTNAQNWLAALALADGVNGNNTGAVANWLWNGTTYDRARGDLTNGAWVNVKTSVLPTGASTSALQTSAAAAKGEGATAAAVPSGAQYWGINVGGNLTGVTGLSVGTARAPTVAIVDGSGNQITSFGGSGGTASNYGSAFPSSGTAAGFTDGTNMAAGRVGAVANLAAATNFLDSLGICQYLATPPTITDTRFNQVQCDVNGNMKVTVANTNPNGQAALASSSPVAIAKNSGTGSTVAGAAVGTAGTASAEVVTVQGIASMTPFLSNPGTAANWGIGATAAAVPANANYLGFNSGGNLTGVSSAAPLPTRAGDGTRQAVIDPCEATTQTYAPISITTATTTQIVAASASNKTYICSLFLTSAAADNVGIVEGTGGTCGTGTAGVIGGTTAANGPNFTANGGVFLQAGGKTAVAQTAGTNVGLCLITSAATPLAGGIRYVQAP